MDLQMASLWKRITGFIGDFIFSICIWYLISLIISRFGSVNQNQIFNYFLSFILEIGYFAIIPYKNNGATIGKWFVGTKIVSKNQFLSLKILLIRTVVFSFIFGYGIIILNFFGTDARIIISGVLLITNALLIIFDKKHRGIHDFAAGTWVVKVK